MLEEKLNLHGVYIYILRFSKKEKRKKEKYISIETTNNMYYIYFRSLIIYVLENMWQKLHNNEMSDKLSLK
jgi:hypothetical protein